MEIMCLVQENMEILDLGGWNWLQELVPTTKGIGIGSNMLVKHFRSRAIVGHWYPIISIDFHEHAMAGMMVLR